MNKLIIPLILLFLFSGVYAFTTQYTCLDDDTLLESITVTHYVDGSLDTVEIWNKTTTCDYGCTNNQCEYASLVNETTFSIIFILSASMFWIGSSSRNRGWIVISSMLMLIVSLYIVTNGIVVNGILFKGWIIRIIGIIIVLASIGLFYSGIVSGDEINEQ